MASLKDAACFYIPVLSISYRVSDPDAAPKSAFGELDEAEDRASGIFRDEHERASRTARVDPTPNGDPSSPDYRRGSPARPH